MTSWHMNSLYFLFLFSTTVNCLFPFSSSSSSDDNSDSSEWKQYHNQQALEAKFADIAKKCPHHTQVYSIGKSVQGRDIVVIEFSTNPGTHESRKFFLPPEISLKTLKLNSLTLTEALKKTRKLNLF